MTDFKLFFQRIESSISSNHTCRYVYTTKNDIYFYHRYRLLFPLFFNLPIS